MELETDPTTIRDDDLELESWLTAAEAAEYIGVRREVMSRLVKRGELPSYRNPLDRRMRFFYINDLNAFGDMERIAAK